MVPGEVLGCIAERVMYPSEQVRSVEMELFWVWVAAFIQSFDGAYDDVPGAFREDGTESLINV